MKTAEEWDKEICARDGTIPAYELVTVTYDEIRQIQLDAMKEGMRRAAENVSSYHHAITTPQIRALFCKTILSAAEKLTEKDL